MPAPLPPAIVPVPTPEPVRRPPITKLQVRTLLDTIREWDLEIEGLGTYRATLLRYASEQGQSFDLDVSDTSLAEYARASSGWNS